MPLAGAGRWPALDYHCVAAGDLFGVKSVLLAEQPDAVVGLSNVTALAIKHDRLQRLFAVEPSTSLARAIPPSVCPGLTRMERLVLRAVLPQQARQAATSDENCAEAAPCHAAILEEQPFAV